MTVVLTRPTTETPRVGARTRVRGTLAFLGPAVVAGIAYVDPGNVAVNFDAGSQFGYRLLWVVVAANVVAAFVQSLAAKVGLATGRSLAEVCRDRYRRPVVLLLWAQAEVTAMATDLAELVGGALALSLLTGLPLPCGAALTALAACALLALQRRGRRRFELAIAGCFVAIGAGFLFCVLHAHPSAGGLASGLVPGFAGSDSIVLATAVVGATVMPHAIYVHSGLTSRQARPSGELGRRRALRLQRVDIALAMGAAGLVNVFMLVIAATSLPGGLSGIPAYSAAMAETVGVTGVFLFLVALLASGLASSGVGTLAGELVMAGFLHRRIPRPVRRAATLVPGMAVLLAGVPATDALVQSQLVLGVGIPFTLVPLILATRDRGLMGALVNRHVTTVFAFCCAAAIIGVDVYSTVAVLR
ncbi:Nramp family divalent metal transporter [uncultured Jatrophihabitans sp.]|uniref:Nramp family divalent metal transporter n=1 Tax=uncultured Jatrophihabitans sp. TaxID=1610747 RepID=UPI0035CA3E85